MVASAGAATVVTVMAVAAVTVVALGAVAACKPPPTEADMARQLPEDEPKPASAPLSSPDSEGAVWKVSAQEG